jgi:hypothetical protein
VIKHPYHFVAGGHWGVAVRRAGRYARSRNSAYSLDSLDLLDLLDLLLRPTCHHEKAQNHAAQYLRGIA